MGIAIVRTMVPLVRTMVRTHVYVRTGTYVRTRVRTSVLVRTYVRTYHGIMLCHNFLIGKGHTCVLRTYCTYTYVRTSGTYVLYTRTYCTRVRTMVPGTIGTTYGRGTYHGTYTCIHVPVVFKYHGQRLVY
jgi:hypothetical protein